MMKAGRWDHNSVLSYDNNLTLRLIGKVCWMQAAFTSIICATLFLRTHIAPDGINNAHLYAGFLFFASLQMFFNGIAEMTFTVCFEATRFALHASGSS